MAQNKDPDRVQAGKKAARSRERDEHGRFMSEDEDKSPRSASASQAGHKSQSAPSAEARDKQGRQGGKPSTRQAPGGGGQRQAPRAQGAQRQAPKAEISGRDRQARQEKPDEGRERDEQGRFVNDEDDES